MTTAAVTDLGVMLAAKDADPCDVFTRRVLADVYEGLGRDGDASRERMTAEALERGYVIIGDAGREKIDGIRMMLACVATTKARVRLATSVAIHERPADGSASIYYHLRLHARLPSECYLLGTDDRQPVTIHPGNLIVERHLDAAEQAMTVYAHPDDFLSFAQ